MICSIPVFVLIRVGCCLHHEESRRDISRDPFRSVFLNQFRADCNQTISIEVVFRNDMSSKIFILNSQSGVFRGLDVPSSVGSGLGGI